MQLTLDHVQRLNLHALLGAQRGDVSTIRALWAIQDKIALDPEEEAAIGFKREIVSGQERVVWNPAASIAAREFDFEDAEAARVRAALEAWTAFSATPDRKWLEPLLQSFYNQALA